MKRTLHGLLAGNVVCFLAVFTTVLILPGATEAYRSISPRFSRISGPIQKLRHKRMNLQLKQQMRSMKTRREMRTINRRLNELRRKRLQNRGHSADKIEPSAQGTVAPPVDGKKAVDPQAGKTQQGSSKTPTPRKGPAPDSNSVSEHENQQ